MFAIGNFSMFYWWLPMGTLENFGFLYKFCKRKFHFWKQVWLKGSWLNRMFHSKFWLFCKKLMLNVPKSKRMTSFQSNWAINYFVDGGDCGGKDISMFFFIFSHFSHFCLTWLVLQVTLKSIVSNSWKSNCFVAVLGKTSGSTVPRDDLEEKFTIISRILANFSQFLAKMAVFKGDI